jgi:hypothetical protein
MLHKGKRKTMCYMVGTALAKATIMNQREKATIINQIGKIKSWQMPESSMRNFRIPFAQVVL